MRRNLELLRSREFDLAIVGAGISGACLAHDASLRGLSVAIIDQRDFASATSSASSKLLHGGVRYLQQAQLAKVRESAFECASFQRIAPHLTRYVPFLIPTYRNFAKGRAMLAAGLSLYEILCIGQNRRIGDPAKRVPPPRHCTRSEVLGLAPVLAGQPGLTGAFVLYESHMYNSERMALAFLRTADRNGAALANYVSAESFVVEHSSVRGVRVRDALTGDRFTIRARVVANAAGPWIVKLNATVNISRLRRDITRFSKGVHVVTRQLLPDMALALGTPQKTQAIVGRGGRHIFVIPWRNRSLIGTTNVPFEGDISSVMATEQDARGLVDDITSALPAAGLGLGDVSFAYAGLYPLTEAILRAGVYQGTGHYQLVDHARIGRVDGLISVLGAKYTTARRLAELAANLVERKLDKPVTPCRTDDSPLEGGAIGDLESHTADAVKAYALDLDEPTVRHLVSSYGTDVPAVVSAGREERAGLSRLTTDRESVEAEVLYAVHHEMALRLEDVVFRRTGLGTIGHPGGACLERCAGLMAGPLGWSPSETAHQIQETDALFPEFLSR